MTILVDGSNLLGAIGAHTVDEAKRELVALLGSLARRRSSRVICFFDGERPVPFATNLGAVSVRFSGRRSADDLIAAEVSGARSPQTVVTSDRGLAARVQGRRTEVIAAASFLAELRRAAAESNTVSQSSEDDWENYFSDPENRNI
jgi:predicted RNA-binding protein with PIN domain